MPEKFPLEPVMSPLKIAFPDASTAKVVALLFLPTIPPLPKYSPLLVVPTKIAVAAFSEIGPVKISAPVFASLVAAAAAALTALPSAVEAAAAALLISVVSVETLVPFTLPVTLPLKLTVAPALKIILPAASLILNPRVSI